MLALSASHTLTIEEARAEGALTQDEYNAFMSAVESRDPEQMRSFLREFPDSILIDAVTAEWLDIDDSIELPSDVGGIVITAPAPTVVVGQDTNPGDRETTAIGESASSSDQIY
ncbi:MAG: hypothetical protein AAGC83_08830 [Pseudomonadota bacterium]